MSLNSLFRKMDLVQSDTKKSAIPISVFVVDDHKAFREGVLKILRRHTDLVIVGEASNGIDALGSIGKAHPDIVFLDVKMPDINGIEVAKRLKKDGFAGKIIMLTQYDTEEYVRRAVRAGAVGYLLKESLATDLYRAIETSRENKPFFSSSLSEAIVGECLNWISNAGRVGDLLMPGSVN